LRPSAVKPSIIITWIAAITVAVFAGCSRSGRETGTTPSIPTDKAHRKAISAVDADGIVKFGPFTARLPTGWKPVAPYSDEYVLQLEIQPLDGDPEAGTVLISFHGADDEIDVQSYINRWYGQIIARGGRPTVETARHEEFYHNGLDIHLIRFSGTFRQSRLRGDPEDSRKPNWMHLSAVVRTPGGPWFFRGTGPKRTMLANLERVRRFLMSLEYHES